MKSRVYVRVDHFGAEVKNLYAFMEPWLKGQIFKRRHDGAPLANASLEYWKSDDLHVNEGFPEETLFGLLSQFGKALHANSELRGIDITAVIVMEYINGDQPRGLFFSKEMIELLAEIGAKLEVDHVPDLS